MANIDKPDDLRSLEERLRKAKKAEPEIEELENEDQQRSRAMGMAFKMGVELVVGTSVGALIGWALDNVAGTAPWLMIVFLILGFIAGITNIVRDSIRSQQSE